MKSPFDAIANKPKRERFAGPSTITAFSAVVCLTLFIFFPSDELFVQVTQESNPHPLTVKYLDNLIALYPNEAKLKLLWAEQQIRLGRLENAEHLLQVLSQHLQGLPRWRMTWVHYQLARFKYLKATGVRKQTLAKELKTTIHTIATAPLPNSLMEAVVQEALWLDEKTLAESLYYSLFERGGLRDTRALEQAAQLSLAVGEFQHSGTLFFAAAKNAVHPKDKKYFFLSGIKSYLAGQAPLEALIKAKSQLHVIQPDREVLAALAEVALSANHPAQAEVYIQQAMALSPQEVTHER